MGTIEYYDDENSKFVYEEGGVVRFEHTLRVMYEWEGRWKKPFLKGDLTQEELVDYFISMALDPIDQKFLSEQVMKLLSEYIGDTQTATTFTSNLEGSKARTPSNQPKTYSAEELYALMFSAGIDIAFENRNLNRLLVVLRIISTQNEPPKKMSKADILRQNAALNAQRKAQLKTKG